MQIVQHIGLHDIFRHIKRHITELFSSKENKELFVKINDPIATKGSLHLASSPWAETEEAHALSVLKCLLTVLRIDGPGTSGLNRGGKRSLLTHHQTNVLDSSMWWVQEVSL